MRSLIAVVSLVAATAFVAHEFAPEPAEAGPIWKAQLASLDAGTSVTVQLDKLRTYCLQAAWSETCYKLGTFDGGQNTLNADCTKDKIISQDQVAGLNRIYPWECFDSASKTGLAIRSLDGGPGTTNLYLLEKNP